MTEERKQTRKKDTIKQRKQGIRRKQWILRFMKCVFGFVMLYFLWSAMACFLENLNHIQDEKVITTNIEKSIPLEVSGFVIKETETKESEIKKTEIKEDGFSEEARRIYNANRKVLVLVNKDIELSQDYDGNLRFICNGRLKASGYLYDELSNMLFDAKEAGYTFWISSAYRSRQWQQSLINSDVRKFMKQGMSEREALAKTLEETMPAGHSEHETGLALDILCSDNLNMDISQEQSPGNIWLREHCHEYGFILRYPRDAEGITKISYEPWHFRYVGKEAAQFMVQHGLTLEEYCEICLE